MYIRLFRYTYPTSTSTVPWTLSRSLCSWSGLFLWALEKLLSKVCFCSQEQIRGDQSVAAGGCPQCRKEWEWVAVCCSPRSVRHLAGWGPSPSGLTATDFRLPSASVGCVRGNHFHWNLICMMLRGLLVQVTDLSCNHSLLLFHQPELFMESIIKDLVSSLLTIISEPLSVEQS